MERDIEIYIEEECRVPTPGVIDVLAFLGVVFIDSQVRRMLLELVGSELKSAIGQRVQEIFVRRSERTK